eukprot:CAMPEP_0197659132 /NCGR_PEP_ID=MMETSP1338-20131121/46324_1 /TAXON_ID=43686 ORGANISM="Pelagodinium beii, Strain RCC1491" /NCGR_SAMPLE_ID=MMETSP1338 /ASSEMBLY_ACC=CAM_ASM_000754 /LENGTH=95 /DNA_ID=CAMNT_0043235907 /DNA_START=140 /DNA_END=427 /DNA_ORIENTATION=+
MAAQRLSKAAKPHIQAPKGKELRIPKDITVKSGNSCGITSVDCHAVGTGGMPSAGNLQPGSSHVRVQVCPTCVWPYSSTQAQPVQPGLLVRTRQE